MDSMGYIESSYQKIICNYALENINDNNIGYSFGVTADGVPFDAEAWETDGDLMVTFYLPSMLDEEDFSDEPFPESSDGMQVFHSQQQFFGEQALCVGMVDDGTIESWELLNAYVQFLIDSDLVEFCTDVLNASGMFLIDVMGNDVVAITITLAMGDDITAMTKLDFIPFKEKDDDNGRGNFRVVK